MRNAQRKMNKSNAWISTIGSQTRRLLLRLNGTLRQHGPWESKAAGGDMAGVLAMYGR